MRGLSWLGVPLSAALLFAFSAPHALADDIEVSGKGSVVYKKKRDVNQAREDAIRAALQDALYKALTEKIPRDQMIAQDAIIQSDVLPLAKALVDKYSIVDERNFKKVYEITVTASVDEELLMDNLDAVGFSMDVGSRRTVAVVIDEYFSGDLPPNNEPLISKVTERKKSDQRHDVELPGHLLTPMGQMAAAEAAAEAPPAAVNVLPDGFGPSGAPMTMAMVNDDYYESKRTKNFEEKIVEYFPQEVIERPRPNPVSAGAIGAELLKRDVRLADAMQVSTIRNTMVGGGGLLLPVLSDPVTLSQRAMQIGASAGTDAIMVGTTAIVYSGTSGSRHKAEATSTVRVIDTATGEIVAYATETEVGLGSNSEAAASQAAERLGEQLGEELGEQMFQYWLNRDKKGLEITVNLIGIDSTRLSIDVVDALSGVDGAKDVEQRIFDRTSGLLSLTVTTREDLSDIRTDMLRALYDVPELKNLEEEASVGTNWNFVVH